jgi:smad nuclear-interacting protein 1
MSGHSRKRGRSRSGDTESPVRNLGYSRGDSDTRRKDEYSERRNADRYERDCSRRDSGRSPGRRDRSSISDIGSYNKDDRDRHTDRRDDDNGHRRSSHRQDERSAFPAEKSRSDHRRGKPPPGADDEIDFSNVVWGNAATEAELDAQATASEGGNVVKEKANFGLSGALAEDEATGNMKNNVVLKFCQPLDSASPDKMWRFYVFKGDDILETLHLHRQSSYLVGRDERVADVVLAHPSISKQHCVIQFRKVEVVAAARGPSAEERELGILARQQPQRRTVVRPYIMDLQSTHKTFLNGTALDDSRYYELREKDSLKFGMSSRDYVLMCAEQ